MSMMKTNNRATHMPNISVTNLSRSRNSNSRTTSTETSSTYIKNKNRSSVETINSHHNEIRPFTAPAGNTISRKRSLDPINSSRSTATARRGNNSTPLSVWGTQNRPKTAPGLSELAQNENIRQRNILRIFSQNLINGDSSKNRKNKIDSKIANARYEKGKDLAKYFSKDIELINRIVKEILKGEMSTFDLDELNHSMHSTDDNSKNNKNNVKDNSGGTSSGKAARLNRLSRLATIRGETVQRALSNTDLKIRLEAQINEYRTSPLLYNELCENIKVAKRKRRLALKGRPIIPADIDQMMKKWSVAEKAYFVRGILGSPEGNKYAAKFWDIDTKQGLNKIRKEEYAERLEQNELNRQLVRKKKLEAIEAKDWQLRLKLKLQKEREYKETLERQAAWLPMIFIAHRLVAFRQSILERKERLARAKKMNDSARKITNRLRYYCMTRFRQRICDLKSRLNTTILMKIGWWKFRRRMKAANTLQNYLIALRDALEKFGSSKNINNKGSKILKFHSNVKLIQQCWRQQIKIKKAALEKSRQLWEKVYEKMVADYVKRLYDEEMQALEPENNEIIQINSKRRLQNKSMYPLKKPRANEILEREAREKLFVPWDIEEQIIRGFYRKCKQIHAAMFSFYVQELRLYRLTKLNGKKQRRIYIPFLGLVKEDPLAKLAMPLKPRMSYSPDEEETRVLVLAGQTYMKKLESLWDARTPSRDKKGRLILKNLPKVITIGMKIAEDYRSHLIEEFEIQSREHSRTGGRSSLDSFLKEKNSDKSSIEVNSHVTDISELTLK